ncbi:MAG: bifunctional demethylmenaquinone methyltransferase/2-methoxy-6-polyprenyl-1,4-benzoquinol methylase UbiE [Planctomycetaceae bacterium]|nr:bifunctional demethylmenaquinone methyltransferase/2-methoxy-6-polyprenyl-1,4-benzoquinol methylase UbiE [Planctomycetaceae bacterium]
MNGDVDKSGQRIRRMFGQIAGRYDLLNRTLSAGTDVYWRNRAVQQVPLQPGSRLLDVCTGTGDLALAFWQQGKGQVDVVGTDFTHEMLALACTKGSRAVQKATRSSGTESATRPLTFLEADTQHLPFEDSSFDAVTVAFGLRNCSDTSLALREMARVCKPGGQVMVLEFSMPQQKVLGGLYRFYFLRVLPRVGQLLARNPESAYSYLPESVGQFPSGKALAQQMEQCGLEQVRWTPLTLGIATIYHGICSGSPS